MSGMLLEELVKCRSLRNNALKDTVLSPSFYQPKMYFPVKHGSRRAINSHATESFPGVMALLGTARSELRMWACISLDGVSPKEIASSEYSNDFETSTSRRSRDSNLIYRSKRLFKLWQTIKAMPLQGHSFPILGF